MFILENGIFPLLLSESLRRDAQGGHKRGKLFIRNAGLKREKTRTEQAVLVRPEGTLHKAPLQALDSQPAPFADV